MSGWFEDRKTLGAWVGIVAVILTAVSLCQARSEDPNPSDPPPMSDAAGHEPPGTTAQEPGDPVRIPVRWHGSLRLSVDASGVTTERFDTADLDALPVVAAEHGDIRIDYGGTLELDEGQAFSAPTFRREPSRETCRAGTASQPATDIELSEGSYACVLSDQDRPARIEVTRAWTRGDDSDNSWIELRITTWER